MRKRTAITQFLAISTAISACDPEGHPLEPDLEDDDSHTSAQTNREIAAGPRSVDISDETDDADQGVRRINDDYRSPLFSKVSYASVQIPGCSATLIGPNTLATAAHCDTPTSLTATAQRYTSEWHLNKETEAFTCHLLVNSFPATDLALYHCPANALGVNPGDRWGWVDFDPRDASQHGVGTQLFSTFMNRIDDDPSSGVETLLTYGPIDAIGVSHWANPNYPTAVATDSDQAVDERLYSVWTKLWSNGGSSGSGQFDMNFGKMVLGPQSTGVADNLGRGATSVRGLMVYGRVYPDNWLFCGRACEDDGAPANSVDTINSSYINGLGLSASDYENTWLDTELDYHFDVTADLESLTGENARGLYLLDFESRRQARLWTLGANETLGTGGLVFDNAAAGQSGQWVEVARHDGLNLSADASTVTLDILASGYFRACIDSACSGFRFNADPSTKKTLAFSVPDNAWNQGNALRLETWNAGGSIAKVSVHQTGSAVEVARSDFDSFDDRMIWSDGQPLTMPDADGWRGWVLITAYDGPKDRYQLDTTKLAPSPFSPSHRLCFDVSDGYVFPPYPGASGLVRISRDNGTLVAIHEFDPTVDGNVCVDFQSNFGAGQTAKIEFGARQTVPMGQWGTTADYHVDDVVLSRTDLAP